MKKLLITTMAAVSVGLCAKAADASAFTENGTSFEGLEAGSDFNFEENKNYWQKSAGEDDLFKIIDVVYPQDATPQHWDLTTGEKALSIDTANPILRNVNQQSDTDNSYPAQPVTTPVFFDSVVQFTATDVRPQVDVATNKDKLSVWLYASPENLEEGAFEETEAKTNLVITAGYRDGGSLVQKDYLTGVKIAPETWHRLTIKSFIADSGYLVFNVFIDGQSEPISVDGVTDFLSLVPVNNAIEDIKLQGVAFDGKGAVDDIVFTTTAPEFAEEEVAATANVTITFSNFEAIDGEYGVWYDVNDESFDIQEASTKLELNVGDKISVCFGLLPDYELDSSMNATKHEDGYYVVTIDALTAEGATIAIVTKEAGGSGGVTVDGTQVVIGDDGTIANITTAFDGKAVSGELDTTKFKSYYTAKVENGLLSIKLDQKAAAPFAEATDLEDGKEVLEVGEDASGNPKLTVRIKPYVGLYYGAMTGTALDNMKLMPDYQQATTTDVIEFTATGKAGDTAGFIKIVVTDIAPEATEK